MDEEKKLLRREIAARLLLLREMRFPDNASEMARSLRLTPQAWFNYETGRRTLDAFVATIVVKTYGVDFNWLYGGTTKTLDRALAREIIAQTAKPLRKKKKRRPRRKSPRPVVEISAKDAWDMPD